MNTYSRLSDNRIAGYGRLGFRALGLLGMVLINGCMVGPDYKPPQAPVESGWIETGDSLTTNTPPVEPKWWKNAFNDPELDHLIETAFLENLDLRSAGLRVLQSKQQLAIAIGNQFPQQQQATGSATRQKAEGTTFDSYSVGLNVGWEIDFWGRFRRQVESASAELDASVATYDGVLVSLISQVAQNYILIRTYQDRIKVARNNIKLEEESLRVAAAKSDLGETSELDKDQAESLLNNTKASLSSLEISLQQFKNALVVLLGKPPQDFNGLIEESGPVPSSNAEISLGMPQDLIRRRPDIRLAERQLAAQSAQIGYAVTELYPHFNIGGSIGTSALSTGDLFDNDSKTWNLYGLFEWNIFNYGRLMNNVRLQDSIFQQLLVDYRNTVLQAQADIENAIVAYLKTHEQLLAYKLAADASARAVTIAQAQYDNGEINFNTLLSTLDSNLQQQDLLASTRGNVAAALVQVYKALGGGWEIREGKDPVDLLPDKTKQEMKERMKIW